MADNDTNPNSENLAALRQQAEDGKAAQAELARARKENLFLRAGIDVTKGVGKLLFTSYEGDDLADLQAQAVEVGALADPAAQTTTDPNADMAGFDAARQNTANGVPAGTTPPIEGDLYDEVYKHFHEDEAKGLPRHQRQLAAIDRVIVGAATGDKSVLFDQAAWDVRATEQGLHMRGQGARVG